MVTLIGSSAFAIAETNITKKNKIKCYKVDVGPVSHINEALTSMKPGNKVDKIYAVDVPSNVRKNGYPKHVIAVSIHGNGLKSKENIAIFAIGSFKEANGAPFIGPVLALNSKAKKLAPALVHKVATKEKSEKLQSKPSTTSKPSKNSVTGTRPQSSDVTTAAPTTLPATTTTTTPIEHDGKYAAVLKTLSASKYAKGAEECNLDSYKKKPSAAEKAKKEIKKALGSNNRDVKNWLTVNYDESISTMVVTWALDENLTEGLTKDSARIGTVDVLKALKKSKVTYKEVLLVGTYSMQDVYGNVEETDVINARFAQEIVNKINFDNVNFKDIFLLASEVYIHPAFEY